MYKLLLCWRYLLTRYLALACIVSVMLGVATLIVVNSVMSGFSTKLKDRLHGLLSDMLIESTSTQGFADPEAKMKKIWNSPIGDKIEAMTPTLETFAVLQFRLQDDRNPYQEETMTRPIRLIGIEPEGRTRVGGFAQYLEHQKNSSHPSFALSEKALDRQKKLNWSQPRMMQAPQIPGDPPPPEAPPSSFKIPEGIIVGNAIASFRWKNPKTGVLETRYLLEPGDDVVITTISGQRLAPVYDRFAVCDYFKSEMSEYDSNFVFVPLGYLQKMRGMEDRVTSIQIKLKDYAEMKSVKEALQAMFPSSIYTVDTWEDKQGALLAAIAIEKGILNILLFLIIAVAGFGILAIFAMIVVEKTRDIGILKALGASNEGVMNIFLGYGLLLGVVGAGLGTALGLFITLHVNDIDKMVGKLTGKELFDKSVYYFNEIPTDIQTWSLLLVNLGAIAIAVIASVLPSLRAAMLHPVRALRYE